MIKQICLAVLFTIMIFEASSQDFISNAPQNDDFYFKEFIGENSEGLVVLSVRSTSPKNKKHYLEIVDFETFKVSKSILLPQILEDKVELHPVTGLVLAEDKILLLFKYSNSKSKIQKVYYSVSSLSNNNFKSGLKSVIEAPFPKIGVSSYVTYIINFLKSYNGKNLTAIQTKYFDKKDPNDIQIFTYNDKKDYVKKINLNCPSYFIGHRVFEVGETGNFYGLVSCYSKIKDIEPEDFTYYLYMITGNDKKESLKEFKSDKYLNSFVIDEVDPSTIVVAGTYGSELNKGSSGFFSFQTIAENTSDVNISYSDLDFVKLTDQREMEQLGDVLRDELKNGNANLPYLSAIDLIKRANGRYFLILEPLVPSFTSTTDNPNENIFLSKDITNSGSTIVVSLDKDLAMEFSVLIPKEQSCFNSGSGTYNNTEALGSYSFLDDGDLFILYNENPDNINSTRILTHSINSGGALVSAKIDQKGMVSYKILKRYEKKDPLFFPSRTFKAKNGDLILMQGRYRGQLSEMSVQFSKLKF